MPRTSKYSDKEKRNIIDSYENAVESAKLNGKKKPKPPVSIGTIAKWSRELNGGKFKRTIEVTGEFEDAGEIKARLLNASPRVTLQAQGTLDYILREEAQTKEYLSALEACEGILTKCIT